MSQYEVPIDRKQGFYCINICYREIEKGVNVSSTQLALFLDFYVFSVFTSGKHFSALHLLKVWRKPVAGLHSRFWESSLQLMSKYHIRGKNNNNLYEVISAATATACSRELKCQKNKLYKTFYINKFSRNSLIYHKDFFI